MAEFGHGSIVRLKLKDFMQYNDVEFRPGPSLNVILGPNGAGKSSIVNGIALALGAKTSVLGRADSVTDFIRTGKQQAMTEIELFNAESDSKNYVITRIIKNEAKGVSIWTINGKTSKAKEVDGLVRGLNIQTDNLCQFLPQDKVHDFSKMNSKELLSRTVEAVGDTELKEDHETLKQLQSDLVNSEDKQRMKETTLANLRQREEELQQGVKNFKAKKDIETKIHLLGQKREWCLVDAEREACKEQQRLRDEAQRKVKACELELKPLDDAIKDCEKKRDVLSKEAKTLLAKSNDLSDRAHEKAVRMESIPDEINDIDRSLSSLIRKEQAKKDELEAIETELEDLRAQFREEEAKTGDKSGEIEQKCRALKRSMETDHSKQTQLQSSLREMTFERKALDQNIHRLKQGLEHLMNVKRQKLETLRTNQKLPNGRDACKAVEWLAEHRDEFSGMVYDPIIMCIDVNDAATNARYVETCIPPKELVAFAAENAEDANKLMGQFRKTMKLKVNVVQVDPKANPDRLRPRSGEAVDPEKHDFKGYVKDMFTAPPAIKAYLSKLYNLHSIPVFGPSAEKYLGELVQNFRMLFVGDVRHVTTVSTYSGSSSTTSSTIANRHYLQISMDKSKVDSMEKQLVDAEKQRTTLANESQDLTESLRGAERDVEASRTELKALQQKLNYKKVFMGRINAKESQLAEFKSSLRPADIPAEEEKAGRSKRRLALEVLEEAKRLQSIVLESSRARMRIDEVKLAISPLDSKALSLRQRYDDGAGELDELKIRLGEEQEGLRAAKDSFATQLRCAQQATGNKYKGTDPPPQLVEAFLKFDIADIGAEEARIRIGDCEAELECLDDVDPKVIREYNETKSTIEELEAELQHWGAQNERRKTDIAQIRERWLDRLERLVVNISERFSEFFDQMGFAGDIRLNRGSHGDDFANFGFDVLVKFRDNLSLQRLDPFKQSGGERSVSTAIYMIALQALTKVPFRCVDEINQGMDARNERKVFNLLIETSVRANTAQYFLLTPKLLPDLQYERGVTVLVVHNSSEMCSHESWDMKRFIREAKNAQRRG